MKIKQITALLILWILPVAAQVIDKDKLKAETKREIKDEMMPEIEQLIADSIPEPEKPRFNIGGFFDTQVSQINLDNRNESLLDAAIPPGAKFSQNNLNIYFSFYADTYWKVFSEIRFTNTPSMGAINIPGGFSTGCGTTTACGYEVTPLNSRTDAQFVVYRAGGIFIERAYAEYDRFEFANFRFGRFLTPFGIWSQDHGSPILTSIRTPLMVLPPIGSNTIPIWSTGAQMLGHLNLPAGMGFDYAIYTSNGLNPNEAMEDRVDRNWAVGAFTNLTLPSIIENLRNNVGVSTWQGQKSIYSRLGVDSSGSIREPSADIYSVNQYDKIYTAHFKSSLAGLPLDGIVTI